MQKFTFLQKLKYAFDGYMAKGAAALILLLAIASAVIVFFFAAIVVFFQVPEADTTHDIWSAAWASLMRTLDSGTMGGDTGTFGWIMLGVTIGGIFIVSALIGVINTGLEAKIEELRKGRSFVAEKNHVVILGWSDQIFTVVRELLEANKSQRNFCIVIMGEKDKTEMEDELASKVGKVKGTRIVCRNGNPVDVDDLYIVNPNQAKSIILLTDLDQSSDAGVIKILVALVNHPNRKKEPYHIIAQIRTPQNVLAAQIAGKSEVEVILVGDLVARIMAQTCRQPGLSAVYSELLDFEGQEMYLKPAGVLAGKTYGDTLLAYPTATVIGIIPAGATAIVNPPMNTKLGVADRLILIAEDDSAIEEAKPGLIKGNPDEQQKKPALKAKPEDTLLIGWNWKAPLMIRELNGYVAKGSKLTVAVSEDVLATIDKKAFDAYKNLKITWVSGDTTNRDLLDGLKITTFNHAVLMAYSDDQDMESADSASLITLLHLRDIQEKEKKFITIVSEMLNIKNKELAEIAKVNDFIVSDKLISLLIAQVAEEKNLNQVFADIFDPEGSEIYLKAPAGYVKTKTPVTFASVIETGKAKGETAIGYKIAAQAHNASTNYGVVINPSKTAPITFTDEDMIILAASD